MERNLARTITTLGVAALLSLPTAETARAIDLGGCIDPSAACMGDQLDYIDVLGHRVIQIGEYDMRIEQFDPNADPDNLNFILEDIDKNCDGIKELIRSYHPDTNLPVVSLSSSKGDCILLMELGYSEPDIIID